TVSPAAFDYALAAAGETVMDIRVQLSSCVPATDLESAGARIEAADLLPYRDHPKALGLAEFMNFPGVVAADPACLAKLAAFAGRHVDGHAPLLSGAALNAYAAAGIRTDHEATGAAEALEKIRKGMTVLIREGSVSKDLHALAPLLTERTAPFLAFCTDDRNPLDIAEEGHLDHLIRTAIALGVPPLAAYRAASLSAATAFGLTDRGLIAPGRRADIVLLDDIESCAVSAVLSAGRLVDEALFAGRRITPAPGRGSVRAEPVAPEDLAVAAPTGETSVIGVVPGRIITEHRRLTLAAVPDPAQDVVAVAVVARHGTRSIGRGLVQGFGLRSGAIASSVGHDSHNLCVVGADPAAMARAVPPAFLARRGPARQGMSRLHRSHVPVGQEFFPGLRLHDGRDC
ncbi:adenine deaminase C-terminal domain-containing protein, partial [Methylobacterium variabile]|uniref:adenine deaminase C-terminal domain-containing protein n=1 Tax=Methylobacterium variabile TaxID=298794 RepID=UPI000B01323A